MAATRQRHTLYRTSLHARVGHFSPLVCACCTHMLPSSHRSVLALTTEPPDPAPPHAELARLSTEEALQLVRVCLRKWFPRASTSCFRALSVSQLHESDCEMLRTLCSAHESRLPCLFPCIALCFLPQCVVVSRHLFVSSHARRAHRRLSTNLICKR